MRIFPKIDLGMKPKPRLDKNQKYFLKIVVCLVIVIILGGYVEKYYLQLVQDQENQVTGKGQIPFPYPYRAIIKIEIDYSENISIDTTFMNYWIFYVFNQSKILPLIIWDQKLNVSAITFSYDNCSEYALLMNRTRTYLDAIHVLLLENFTVNGIYSNWGYSMFLPYWTDMIQNYSEPRFTGNVVAYNRIMRESGNDTMQVCKVICHECGHSLGCTHSEFGVMQVGYITPYFEFYFGIKSELEMNPYNIFGVHQSFSKFKS